MNLEDIVAVTFKFHRAVYISLTQKCPIRCRHCFVEAGPERDEGAGFANFKTWIDGLLRKADLEIFFFSGGEPYSHPKALRYGLEATAAAGRYSVIATSAFWGKTDATASRMLDKFPKPSGICISTDIYHEEFVPLRNIRIAAEAAKARGIDVTVQITRTSEGYPAFLNRFETEVGFELIPPSEIFIADYNSIGRALTECPPEPDADTNSQLPSAPCVWLGTPWLHEDGVVCACPNLEVFKSEGNSLRIGNLNAEGFEDVSFHAERDYFIQALRVYGPKGLLDMLPLYEFGLKNEGTKWKGVCDLCNSISKDSNIPDRIREYLRENDLEPRIDALRLAIYGELAQL